MELSISRRKLAAIAVSLPLARSGVSHAVIAQQGVEASIGDKQAAFDSLFGTSRTEAGFTVYDFSGEGKAVYQVGWDAHGFADRIANDYSAIEGGLPFHPGLLGQSQFLPTDASINLAGDLTNMQVGHTGFYVAQHHSVDVRTATNRSGNILVVDQRAIPGDGPNNPNLTRTSVAMEAWEVNPIVPTGQLPTMESDWQQWQAVFGESWGTQRGSMPTNPPIPGRWMFDGSGIDVLLDQTIPTAEAAQWVSDFLPLGLGEMGTTYWLPGPEGDQGLRVCLWPHGNGMSTVALQVVHGGEAAGSVSRFVINTIAPATV